MVEVYQNGLTRLSSNAEQPRCNIIFIHGLKGHPQTTWEGQRPADIGTVTIRRKGLFGRLRKWRARSNIVGAEPILTSKVFWPQELLAKDISDARIWTYGYNADVIGIFEANNQNSVSQHGRGLAAALERDIDNKKPLIFIVHNLGGIVLKDALRRSELCQRLTRLIIFLGTPHRGSRAADMGQIAASLAYLVLQDSNKGILRNLQVDSEVLENIHEGFAKIALQRNIAVHTFQESKGMIGIKGLSGKIVDSFSSRLDLPTIETIEPIDADHQQMAKCSRREDETYRKIIGELRKRIKNGVLEPNPSVLNSLTSASPLQKRHILLPFTPNKCFTGRQETLMALEHNLFIDKKSQHLAITGLGGVGKTQVVLALSYAVKEKYSDYSIFWVSAVSIERFKQDYVNIAKKCSIGIGSKEDELVQIVQDYLSNEDSGKWLLIIDNADDQTLLFDNDIGIIKNLPQSENGITIFTTRYRHIAVDVASGNILHLEKMSLGEAKMFLQKALDRYEDGKIMEELLEELTYLPLAINQAASYIVKTSIAIVEYLELMRDTEEEMVKLLSRDFQDSAGGNTRNAVAVTWLISFSLIKRDEPNAADMLFFLASIENKAIPRSLLPVHSKGDMIHAIGVLIGYSFLTKQEDSETYDMHRLVHLAVKVFLQKEGVIDHWREKMISHLADIFPSNEWENRGNWRAYAPHTVRALQDTEQMASEQRAKLCLSLGLCFWADRRTSEAIKWIEKSVLWRDLLLPEENADRLKSQHELAMVYGSYGSNGQIKEAVKMLEKIVGIRARVLAEDHPDRLSSQYQLAFSYRVNGQTKEAVEILEDIVAIEAKMLAEDHPDRLTSQIGLALAYQSNGQIKEAVEMLENIVAIEARVFAEDHPDRLASQMALARAYRLDGQVTEAVKIGEHVTIYTRVLPEDHPSRLLSEHDLALAYESSNQVDKAVSLMQHVVTIRQKSLRVDHRHRIESEIELSRMLHERDAKVLLGKEAQQLTDQPEAHVRCQ